MLKILTSKQIKALDDYTIRHEPITSIELMERACRAFVSWFGKKFDSKRKIGIVCGTGNNGGDGLGIARILYDMNYLVKVFIVRGAMAESEDFKANFGRLQKKMEIMEITSAFHHQPFSDCPILVDAMFGTGLSRPAEGIYAQVISAINQADAIRVSVDIPSGLMADSHSDGHVVCAHCTASFQLPKLAFLLPENAQYAGEWHIVNIGLNKECIANTATAYHFIEKDDIKKIKRDRSTFAHKGNFGKALIIAGSHGKIGAAVLAAKAAMRSGLGLLTVHVPQCGYSILQATSPEAMVSVDENDNFFTRLANIDGYDSIGIGPGLGNTPQTVSAFTSILEKAANPLVIDADGLNILSQNRALIAQIPAGSILTPHPKEFERLVGKWKNDFDRLEKLKAFAIQTKGIVILKGAYTAIASAHGHVYFNPTGNPGMATGGSGDVLTGIITGLLAQHYPPLQAAQMGVYLHGLSGDLAQMEKSMEGLIATDLVDYLPNAFKTLG